MVQRDRSLGGHSKTRGKTLERGAIKSLARTFRPRDIRTTPIPDLKVAAIMTTRAALAAAAAASSSDDDKSKIRVPAALPTAAGVSQPNSPSSLRLRTPPLPQRLSLGNQISDSVPNMDPPSWSSMAVVPVYERIKQMTKMFQDLVVGTSVNQVLLAAATNQPGQLELVMKMQPVEHSWDKVKEIKCEKVHSPEAIAALFDNLEFVQTWAELALQHDGTLPATLWVYACMGPSLRTLSWLFETHFDTIFSGFRANDMTDIRNEDSAAQFPPMTLCESLRNKKLVARAVCYVLDSIEHCPRIYTFVGRDERAVRAEDAICMIRDRCAEAAKRPPSAGSASNKTLQIGPGPKFAPIVFSKTPLRHAALYGSLGCFEIILESTSVPNPSALFEALFPHFERNSFRDNNVRIWERELCRLFFCRLSNPWLVLPQFRFAVAFLRFLDKVVPEDERPSIAARYMNKARVYFKDANFFRYILNNDYIRRDDPNLVGWVLSLHPHILWSEKYPRPILRRHMIRCLAYVGSLNGISSSDLALIIEAVKDDKGPLSQARGLIRVALFYGADATASHVRRQVREPPAKDAEYRLAPPEYGKILYHGFAEDVKSTKYWAKWMAGNCLGGLPPELTREILLWHWETFV